MKPQQILNKLAKYNEVQKVELSAEPMKVEFAIGDGLQKKADEVYAIAKKLDSLLNDAYVPIRQIENGIQKLESDPVQGQFQDFVKKLQSLEAEYQSEKSKAESMARELGIDMPQMQWINEVNGVLEYAQRAESTARQDINTYSSVYKAAIGLLSKLK